MNKNEHTLLEQIADDLTVSKHLKTAGIVFGCVAGIYFLGHFFKVTAHCVRGFNDLKNAIKNG